MNKTIQLYQEGWEEYPKHRIILANIVMVLWLIVGSLASAALWKPAGGIFLAYAVVMVYFVMRKLVCTNCYYYDRWCNIGWGKLAARLYKQGDISQFAGCTGIKIAPFFYASLSLVPLILGVIALFFHFSWLLVLLLALLLAIGFYSGTVSRKKACTHCKMRLICPGSAVK